MGTMIPNVQSQMSLRHPNPIATFFIRYLYSKGFLASEPPPGVEFQQLELNTHDRPPN
jgi:hypothetical protein